MTPIRVFAVALDKEALEGPPCDNKTRFNEADYRWRDEVAGYFAASI